MRDHPDYYSVQKDALKYAKFSRPLHRWRGVHSQLRAAIISELQDWVVLRRPDISIF